MKVGAVIVAAGRGVRFGGDKLWRSLGGKPVWRWSTEAFLESPHIDEVVVVCASDRIEDFKSAGLTDVTFVEGGAARQESVYAGLQALSSEIALIHDGARPFPASELIEKVLGGVEQFGAAAPVVDVIDTLRGPDSQIIDRQSVRAMQTPQGVRRKDWLESYKTHGRVLHTDDLGLLQAAGLPVGFVEGDPRNLKITTEVDMALARGLIGGPIVRTGFGYDIHRFSSDPHRAMILGGVKFDGTGLDGHSDADALLHAVVDAILGAGGLGDIGQHFPNTDPRWKDCSSSHFLKEAVRLVRERGWSILNMDATVVAQMPKVMVRADEIRQVIAEACSVGPTAVSIKATTNEELGALGRGEGLAAYAVATLRES
ncbi:MAG TPA: 2-C-methyl-D-erythritol 4-phosphate cytidylyltransferase [Fimbriimonadaceae bacterium]|nr:2-C-methyl-D-erythritol 4-phosphate cytidylyltransferase [Fimbriimonadaceae bacterium]